MLSIVSRQDCQTDHRAFWDFKNSLWDKLIPQTSEGKPFIRHAMVALGALSKLSVDAKRDHKNLSTDYKSQYAYALKQYDKALQGMRTAIANWEHDMSKSLIACILVFCFESLLGMIGSAVTNAESGLMFLHC